MIWFILGSVWLHLAIVAGLALVPRPPDPPLGRVMVHDEPREVLLVRSPSDDADQDARPDGLTVDAPPRGASPSTRAAQAPPSLPGPLPEPPPPDEPDWQTVVAVPDTQREADRAPIDAPLGVRDVDPDHLARIPVTSLVEGPAARDGIGAGDGDDAGGVVQIAGRDRVRIGADRDGGGRTADPGTAGRAVTGVAGGPGGSVGQSGARPLAPGDPGAPGAARSGPPDRSPASLSGAPASALGGRLPRAPAWWPRASLGTLVGPPRPWRPVAARIRVEPSARETGAVAIAEQPGSALTNGVGVGAGLRPKARPRTTDSDVLIPDLPAPTEVEAPPSTAIEGTVSAEPIPDVGLRPRLVDPVADLQAALGLGGQHRGGQGVQDRHLGPGPGDGRTSASPQSALPDDVVIEDLAAVRARNAPLAHYVEKIDEIVDARWNRADLGVHDRAIGIQGQVTVLFSIGRDGRRQVLELSASSGNPDLDRLALEAIPTKFPPIPKGLETTRLWHRLTLRYRNPYIPGGG